MLTRLTAAFALIATPVLADFETRKAEGTVAEVIDRLEAAVEEAGATVFARVDHAAGARDVNMELRPQEVLIFGNPQLGTPAIQADPRAGLALPLRMTAYEDAEGQVWVVYEEVDELFDDLDIDDDADFVKKMEGALDKLAGAAAG